MAVIGPGRTPVAQPISVCAPLSSLTVTSRNVFQANQNATATASTPNVAVAGRLSSGQRPLITRMIR